MRHQVKTQVEEQARELSPEEVDLRAQREDMAKMQDDLEGIVGTMGFKMIVQMLVEQAREAQESLGSVGHERWWYDVKRGRLEVAKEIIESLWRIIEWEDK